MIADYETNVVYFSSWLEKEYPKIYIDLVTVLKKNNVAYDIIPCTNDIWCRDYMPVQIDEDRFLCYRYYPDYLLKRKSDKRFITDSQEVCMRLGLKTTNTNIIMDGGNIVKVGDKVIMTEKVFQENPDMSPSSLGSKIEKLFEKEIDFSKTESEGKKLLIYMIKELIKRRKIFELIYLPFDIGTRWIGYKVGRKL